MRLIDWFQKGMQRAAHEPAFVGENSSLTYAEVDRRAREIASAMKSQGLVKAAVYSPNDARAFGCIIGIFYAGGVWLPANARNTVAANVHFLSMTECQVLFYHSQFEQQALDLRRQVPTLKVLICMDGQGSDGTFSMDDFVALGDGSLPEVPDDPDRIATIFPTGGTMTHAAGGLALMMVPGGATNVVLPKADPELIMQAIDRHKVTHIYLPPTVLYMMLSHPNVRKYDYSSLRYFVLAAAPVSPDKLREAMAVFGPVMCQSYGQAEAPMFLTFLSSRDLQQAGSNEGARRLSSCGRTTLNVRVEIMSEEGALLAPGERGEIFLDITRIQMRRQRPPGLVGITPVTSDIATRKALSTSLIARKT